MDSKWDVFAEDGTLFLHRSWTGNGIYEVYFVPIEGGGWRIAKVVAEFDPERYRAGTDEFDSVMVELVISTVILAEAATELREKFRELARQRSGLPDIPAGVIRHSVLGVRTER